MCQCECGNKKEISSSNLKDKKTLSCGCLHSQIASNKHSIDITGQKFGKLTVLKRTSEIGEAVKWLCQCECGSLIEVRGSNLKKEGANDAIGIFYILGQLFVNSLQLVIVPMVFTSMCK